MSKKNYFLPKEKLEEVLHNLQVTIQSETSKDLLCYCFSGDTTYLTEDGVKDFGSTVGTTQRVLSPNADVVYGKGSSGYCRAGKWVDAKIEYFGKQKVLNVHLKRNGKRRVVRATPEHRWVKRNSYGTAIVTTEELKPGHLLGVLTPNSIVKRANLNPVGIANGFVFGDGTCSNSRHGAQVTLWGEKDEALMKYFGLFAPSTVVTENGVGGLRYSGLPSTWKSFPPENESVSYKIGWLAGYFAADGTVNKSGQVVLNSYSYQNLKYVRELATSLGIATYEISEKLHKGFDGVENYLLSLTFSRTDLSKDFFLILEHKNRFVENQPEKEPLGWTVEKVVDENCVTDVYCAVVPGTEAFALDEFIWVKNCPFHKNKDTPAFAISIRGPHLWKCNNGSCAKTGNIITLLMLKGYSFSESEKMVLKSTFEVDDLEKLVKELLGEDVDELNGWEEINPKTFQEADRDNGLPALQYLENRGVSFEAYDYFQMGYSKSKDMVVIPVFDEKNFLVGVIGREIHTKRYQYSSGLARGKLIWNINNAKKHNSIILTEGALDAVAIWQAGFHNVGAVLGSSISPNQWSQLGKYFSEIICFFDNDDAGKALRDLIVQNIRDLTVRYVEYPDRRVPFTIPDGTEIQRQLKDPGELEVAEITDMVTNSLSSIDWLLSHN